MASLTFNANEVEPSSAYELLPAGDYIAMITSSETKATNSGTGSYIKLRFDIVDGAGKGRVIFTNLNMWNQNPTAVEIAQKDLSAICRAVNVMQLSDSSQLHDRPMIIKVGIQPAKDGYEASNAIKGYKPLNEAKQPNTTQQTMPQPTATTNTNTPPWAK